MFLCACRLMLCSSRVVYGCFCWSYPGVVLSALVCVVWCVILGCIFGGSWLLQLS